MNRQEAVIGAPVAVIQNDGTVLPALVDLGWNLEDPLVVHASFRMNGETVEWIVGRDLLADGINSPDLVGDGAVRLRGVGDSTSFTLYGEGPPCELLVKNAVLVAFVDATEHLCAAGSDVEGARMVAWVDALLLAWDLA